MPENRSDYLIVRYLSNEATPEEQERLFNWVADNKRNQKLFNEYISLWSNNPQEHAFNVELGLEKLNARIDVFDEAEKKRSLFWNRWNIAAAITLLIASGFVLFYMGRQAYHQHELSLLKKYTAGEHSIAKLTLSDSSVVTLNAKASLQYPESFQGNTREIYLKGEAFFEVEKDSLHPFIIHIGDLTTTVLGTSFNVNAQEDNIIVTVATGKVLVSNNNQTETLLPYEKVTYHQEAFRKEKTDLTSELSWNDRSITFLDTPLEQAAVQLSKYFDVKIYFDNDSLKKCVITGKFKNKPLDDILNALEYSVGLHYQKEGNKITFSGKGCE
jgi:ferric-dicitrate binding protein FerR (iron transport regulator)